MKAVALKKGLVLVALGLMTCASVFADDAALSRSQWMQKVSDCAADVSVLKSTLSQVPAADRVEFTQKVLKAVNALPVTPEEKSKAFVEAMSACLDVNAGAQKLDLIAEVFATVPVSYLPAVTEQLAANLKRNNLSDAAYETLASRAIEVASKRNAKTDEPAVRDTFVTLAFLRGAKDPAALQDKLIAKLPDEHNRQVASELVPGVLATQNYTDVVNAAGEEVAPVEGMDTGHTTMGTAYGHPNLDALLADLGVASVKGSSGEGGEKVVVPYSNLRFGSIDLDDDPTLPLQAVDTGLDRIPRFVVVEEGSGAIGYQGQALSVYEDAELMWMRQFSVRRKHGGGRRE
ncbi:MAG: hypothetical protein J6334_06735 [Kiritimatiellae bacterium]|nr:hypothetical protein [Kiritimatiellia bacterium]